MGSRKEALSVSLLQMDGAIRVQGNWKEHSKLELTAPPSELCGGRVAGIGSNLFFQR